MASYEVELMETPSSATAISGVQLLMASYEVELMETKSHFRD